MVLIYFDLFGDDNRFGRNDEKPPLFRLMDDIINVKT